MRGPFAACILMMFDDQDGGIVTNVATVLMKFDIQIGKLQETPHPDDVCRPNGGMDAHHPV